MGSISIQMIDNTVSSYWWKELVRHFVRAGNDFEIRCWKEETDEIQQASVYGIPEDDQNEVSVKGIVTEELLKELLSEEPTDKSLYNKMTKYFTINVNYGCLSFCSAHYGTEMYLEGVSDEDLFFVHQLLDPYGDGFSVNMIKS